MRKAILICILSGFYLFIFQINICAQSKKPAKKIVVKAKPPSGTNNYQLPTVDTLVAKKTGANCKLNFENWTGYYIDVWVDEKYQGRLSPYASLNTSMKALGNVVKWYAHTLGGAQTWNGEADCKNGKVIVLGR